jgi:hypothetical protein
MILLYVRRLFTARAVRLSFDRILNPQRFWRSPIARQFVLQYLHLHASTSSVGYSCGFACGTLDAKQQSIGVIPNSSKSFPTGSNSGYHVVQ